MHPIINLTPKYVYAGIDLGNGRFVEITNSGLNLLDVEGQPRSDSRSRTVGCISELAQMLCRSQASLSEIDRAAASLEPTGLCDGVIEHLAARGAELIRSDPNYAYYLLRLTYAVAQRWGTLWKQALLSGLLGFAILYDRQFPREAIPVFEDLGIISRILGSYLGCSAVSQGLSQLARKGLEEARRALGAADAGAGSESEWAARIWSVIQEHSRGMDESQSFRQSEAFARGSLLLSDRTEMPVAARCSEMGISHVVHLVRKDDRVPPAACLPVITLAEVLARCGFKLQALEVLEQVRATCGESSLFLEIILSNRLAEIHHALGHHDLARQLLESMPSRELISPSSYSISAQGELLLYALNWLRTCRAEADKAATRYWTNQVIRQLYPIEEWSQKPSQTRLDDLRVLYCAVLQDAAHHALADIRRTA